MLGLPYTIFSSLKTFLSKSGFSCRCGSKKVMLAVLVYCLSFGLEAKITGFPGGIVRIPLGPSSEKDPELFFNKHRVLIQEVDHQSYAVIGISVNQKTGLSTVTRLENGSHLPVYTIDILEKDYPFESINIKDKSKVTPSSKNLKRIDSERKILSEALSNWSYQPISELSLVKPVNARISSEFGFKRIINGQPRAPHRGIDFAANRGTAIKASARGKVSYVGDLFFTGNTVVVDHGQGWQTIYCHLDEKLVKRGDVVDIDSILGTVGSTGRATGPHLHFGLILNQARVDPSQIWKLDN